MPVYLPRVKPRNRLTTRTPRVYLPIGIGPSKKRNLIPLYNPTNARIKRTFDLVFSSVVIIGVLSWFLPLLALIIVIDSRGNPFYLQTRSGYKGKKFSCIKLRTMRRNNDEFIQATKNDSRVTRVGTFLRQHSLDELPQFLNVFLGDMSVIGPRPHPIALDDQFISTIDAYPLRWRIKPGVSGLAQIRGHRGATMNNRDMQARVTLDNFYIQNWTFKLDMRIILRTILKTENAY